MTKHGFVIPMTLMLIAVAMVIITGIYQKGSLFIPFTATMMKRNSAKLLALSGVQIAMSQLAVVGVSSNDKKNGSVNTTTDTMLRKDGKSSLPQEAQFLSDLLPLLNQWQKFPLKESVDGIDGEIDIAIACEQGKIDLNAIYDFSKKRFRGENEPRGDWKKIMRMIFGKIQKTMGISANLFEAFEIFMKERQYRVNDATELLTLNPFRAFAGKEFYKPVLHSQQEDRPLNLLDIFTVYGNKPTLQPWFFSSSMRTILDMKPDKFASTNQKKTVVKGWLKNFKSSMNWEQDWNKIFQPMYGVEYQHLPKGIDTVFETTFDPRLFSVVSYGVVGDITQRAYAIVERIRRTMKNKTWYDLKIKKFYWI